MRAGEGFTVNYMSAGNDSLWLWLDIKVLRFWYVLMWRKGLWPYLYRSTDATPPCDENGGRWIFGRATGCRNY